MAIRAWQPSDRELARTWWNTARAQEQAFIREQGWSLDFATRLYQNPRAIKLIDTDAVAQSVGLFFRHDGPAGAQVSLAWSTASTAQRRFRAANRMIAFGLRILQSEGKTHGYGEYEFAQATNTIVSYWQGIAACTVTITPDGALFRVRVTAQLEAICSELEARG